jgi:hypothetical protein
MPVSCNEACFLSYHAIVRETKPVPKRIARYPSCRSSGIACVFSLSQQICTARAFHTARWRLLREPSRHASSRQAGAAHAFGRRLACHCSLSSHPTTFRNSICFPIPEARSMPVIMPPLIPRSTYTATRSAIVIQAKPASMPCQRCPG